MGVRYGPVSNRVVGRNAGIPAKTPRRRASAPVPNAVRMPKPVIVTSPLIPAAPFRPVRLCRAQVSGEPPQ